MSAPYQLQGKRVWVAGHRGMVGAAVVRRLAEEGCQVLTAGRDVLNLERQDQVESWMAEQRPDAVVMAAAKVGGILANDTYPADFLYKNLIIEANVTEAARQSGVEKLLFLGSSCIYPKFAPQPITEDALLTGPLEPTNEWYVEPPLKAFACGLRPPARALANFHFGHVWNSAAPASEISGIA